ncbi:MAG: hypothetical protein DRG09_02120 [Epsilonproteobacteria bacterium]|nr:MAG: hypothetical protein DRG09_02120 [Campylobacterota bacterium]
MTKYILALTLIISAFLTVGCQEKLQSGKRTTHPTQAVEPIPTVPVKIPEPTVPTKPVQPISETKPTVNTEQEKMLSFIKKEGILKVKMGEKVCLLADDAIDYETFVSPNSTMIALETLLMSNLQTVRIYKKDAEGCFKPLQNKLSTKLWHDLSEQEGFNLEDVSHPRMKFLKWIDNEQVQIELSGEIENKAIDTNVSADLKLLI